MIIFISIILFLVLLLIIPFRIEFLYKEDFTLFVKYLFVKINLTATTDKSKKEKTTKEEKTKDEKKENTVLKKIKEIHKTRGTKGFLNMLKKLISDISHETYDIIKGIKIKYIDIYFVAGGEDASACAMQYGTACEIIYPFASLIRLRCKKVSASVDINYKLEKPSVNASGEISIVPLFVLGNTLQMIFKVIRDIIKKDKRKVRSQLSNTSDR